MTLDETQKKLNEYFTEKLETFGATAKGVDYNGEQAQQIRFAELVKIINSDQPYSVIDYGCGYGAMFEYLHAKGWDFAASPRLTGPGQANIVGNSAGYGRRVRGWRWRERPLLGRICVRRSTKR